MTSGDDTEKLVEKEDTIEQTGWTKKRPRSIK